MKRPKKYETALKNIDPKKTYTVDEAVSMLPKISFSKFPGTVSMSFKLKLNEKQKKEVIRGSYTLPNSFGKEIKILLFADPSYKKANSKADIVGGEELVKDVEEGKLDYDVVIAMPAMMPKIARLGKVIGAKGLMPNPKNGTVTPDPDSAIAKFKSGQKSFKMDESGLIRVSVGKTDMKPEQLKQNIEEMVKSLNTEVKKLGPNPIASVTMAPTMGPRLKVSI